MLQVDLANCKACPVTFIYSWRWSCFIFEGSNHNLTQVPNKPWTWTFRHVLSSLWDTVSFGLWHSTLFSEEERHLCYNHSVISQLTLPRGMHGRKSRHRKKLPSNARGSEKWRTWMVNQMLRSLDFKMGGRDTRLCRFAGKDPQLLELRPIIWIVLLTLGMSKCLHNYSWLRWLTLGEGTWRGKKDKSRFVSLARFI